MTANDQPLGQILRDGDRTGLRYVRDLAHPPAKVWRALTDSSSLRHWMPCDIVGERRAGAAIELPFWPEVLERHEVLDPVAEGEILVWDPERTFEWTWGGDVLRFELDPTAAGTRLTLTTWLDGEQQAPLEGAAAGYHACLANLVSLLDTGAAPPLMDADTPTWEQRYAEHLAADRTA